MFRAFCWREPWEPQDVPPSVALLTAGRCHRTQSKYYLRAVWPFTTSNHRTRRKGVVRLPTHTRAVTGASEESKAKTSNISNLEPTDAIVRCKLTRSTASGGDWSELMAGVGGSLRRHTLDGLNNGESASITRREHCMSGV
jgi:hypothetical protein